MICGMHLIATCNEIKECKEISIHSDGHLPMCNLNSCREHEFEIGRSMSVIPNAFGFSWVVVVTVRCNWLHWFCLDL